jgi:STE24 endopeptidase
MAVGVVGLALGVYVDREPVSTRAEAMSPAGVDWEGTLPADPVAATDAWLARLTPAARASGRAVTNTRLVLLPVRLVVLTGCIALLLFTGAASRLQDVARRLSARPPVRDAIVAMLLLLILFLVNLPVDTYAGFVLFRRNGFSHAPYQQWLRDAFVNWAVLSTFYVVGVVAIMALIRKYPRGWAVAAVGVYVVVRGIYVVAAPVYIEPLFNRITPLADGPAKEAVLSLARANGVPAHDVFVRDASRQSRLLNGHVSGFGGTARIVLDDNTIADAPLPEVAWMMGHEIGHYVMGHVVEESVYDGLVMALGFLLIAWAMRHVIARFGARWRFDETGGPAAIVVFWYLFLLWWSILSVPINNAISRPLEAQADLYGLNASQQAMAAASLDMRTSDAFDPDPSTVTEWLLYDHPTARNRVLAAMRWRAEHLTPR